MGKSTKTTQNQTTSQNSTMTPVNPEWVTQGAQGLAGKISDYGNTDPYSLVPGASDLQSQAFNQAGGLLGQPNPYIGAAQSAISTANSATTPQVTGSTIDPTSTFSGSTAYGGISNYMNPYETQAVQSALGDIGYQGQIADQYAKSRATSNGAWGGDGEAVLRGITGDNYVRQQASTAASMRNQGFQTALGASQQDAQRAQEASAANAAAANARAQAQAQLAQQASTTNAGLNNDVINRYMTSAGLLGGLGQQYQAGNAQNVGLLGDLGGVQRDIAGEQANAPGKLLGQEAYLFNGMPLNLFQGQDSSGTGTSNGTTTQSQPLLQSLLGGLGTAAFGAGALGWKPFGK